MKHPLKFIFAFFTLLFFITCSKEEDAFVETPAEQSDLRVHNVDDFDLVKFTTGNRDGGQDPFHFPTSQTITDPFSTGSPQTAYNPNISDSTTYERVSEPNAGAYDGEFDKYNIAYYFPDTVYRYYDEYAPSYLGDSYTYVPPTFNAASPFEASNLTNTLTLVRHSKFENYWDFPCGKQKRRFFYIHMVDGVMVGTFGLRGDRCNSNIYSFKHVL